MDKTSAELLLANKKLLVQYRAKEKLSNKLIAANKELAFQNAEREKRAAELAFQNNEKEKRATELLIANQELAFQNKEKEKRAAELLIANQELAFQNNEKEKRAAELILANKELAFQNIEKEKRAAELLLANNELKDAHKLQQENIRGLQEMMYMLSHELRQPIVQILGLTSLFDTLKNSPEETVEMAELIRESARSLDNYTRELTMFIYQAELKAKNELNT